MFDKVIEIRGFYICNAYVLVLIFVAFHMWYLELEIEIKEFYICNAYVLVFSICCFSHGVF